MKNSKILNANIVEFKNTEKIYFPSVCVVCGAETENRVKKNEYGTYIGGRDIKKDYSFNIPVCEDCNSKVNLKTGIANKSGKLLLFSSFLGITLSILFYFLFYSVVFSVSILGILILFAYLNYQKKTETKINLNNYFQVNLKNYSDEVELTFANKSYAEFVDKINLEKTKEKKQRLEEENRKKAEKLKKEENSEEENKINKENVQIEVDNPPPNNTDKIKDFEALSSEHLKNIHKSTNVLNAPKEEAREKTEEIYKDKVKIEKENDQFEVDISPPNNIDENEDSNTLLHEDFENFHKTTSVLNVKKNNGIEEIINDKVNNSQKCPTCGHNIELETKICDNCGRIL